MEFAITHGGDIYLLQTRPLGPPPALEKGGGVLPDSRVLLRGGETACPRVASEVAMRMDEDGDLDTFPQGGVLVARCSSPKFVRIMSKVKAIVTDSGRTTGHMAPLARELGIPALLNAGNATTNIEPGTLVTVDASAGVVYEGDVSSVIRARKEPLRTSYPAKATMARAPEMELLDRVLEHISPLTLTDPKTPEFSPDNARTFHDLARYIHEKFYEEMFGLGEKLGEMRPASYLLDVFLPVDLYILDLGGGLKELPASRKVKPSQVACIPFRALLQGMLHERIPRFGPRFMDLGRFPLGYDAPCNNGSRGGTNLPGSVLRPHLRLLSQLYRQGGVPFPRPGHLLQPQSQ